MDSLEFMKGTAHEAVTGVFYINKMLEMANEYFIDYAYKHGSSALADKMHGALKMTNDSLKDIEKVLEKILTHIPNKE